jgi:phage shock protein E
MSGTFLLLFTAALAVVFILRLASQISTRAAREFLKKGAVLIDVRTPGEYAASHLPNAISLPLDQIEAKLPRQVHDKTTVLLLHCQSGVNSAMARRTAKAMGYRRTYNLGSLARAARIVTGK